MSHTLFVNLPTKDLGRAQKFFSDMGFPFFAMTDDIASVIINDRSQVMLMAEPTFAGYARNEVAEPTAVTQAILVVAVENRHEVDEMAEKAFAAGATPVGDPREADGRYQRGFADLDGHHWEILCLT